MDEREHRQRIMELERERADDHHVKELESALETLEEERDEARAHAREGVKLLEGAMEREERLFAAGLGLADELRHANVLWSAEMEAANRWAQRAHAAEDEAKRAEAHAAHSDAKLEQSRAQASALSRRLAALTIAVNSAAGAST